MIFFFAFTKKKIYQNIFFPNWNTLRLFKLVFFLSYWDVTILKVLVRCSCFHIAQVPTALKSFSKEEEEGRLKRKREVDACDGKQGEEEIKKVCKEGFQLFCHNVCLLFSPLPMTCTLWDWWLWIQWPVGTLTGVVSRSPCVEGLRGVEAWWAGGDAGCSRASARHEQLFGRSAPTSVRTVKHLRRNAPSGWSVCACLSGWCPAVYLSVAQVSTFVLCCVRWSWRSSSISICCWKSPL